MAPVNTGKDLILHEEKQGEGRRALNNHIVASGNLDICN